MSNGNGYKSQITERLCVLSFSVSAFFLSKEVHIIGEAGAWIFYACFFLSLILVFIPWRGFLRKNATLFFTILIFLAAMTLLIVIIWR